ncbi:hypothetical protein [Ehrlichia ruminantium]|nr:hypothetical protein [Ehrlichia ruminantium]
MRFLMLPQQLYSYCKKYICDASSFITKNIRNVGLSLSSHGILHNTMVDR